MCSPTGMLTGAVPGGFLDAIMPKDKPSVVPMTPQIIRPPAQGQPNVADPLAQKRIIMGMGY